MSTAALRSASDAAELAAQVAELARAGLPLAPGLRAAAKEVSSRSLRRALGDVAAKLESGQALDQALTQQVCRLPESLQGLILAGVRTGRLDEVLELFVHQERQTAALRRQVVLMLAYPAVLLMVSYVLVMFYASMVGTYFMPIFSEISTDLPPQTEMLQTIGEMGVLFPTACVLLVVIGVVVCLKLGGGIGYQVPLLGPLWRYCSLADFCRLMSLLAGRQIPLPEAFESTGRSLRDPLLAATCRRLGKSVAAGQPPASALAAERAIPATLRQVVQWGDTLPALADSLSIAAEFYERRARKQLTVVRSVVMPLAMLVALSAIGFVFSSVLIPLIRIISMFF